MPQLWPFQRQVVYEARGAFASGARRVLVQAATGAGKTHMAAEMVRLAVARGRRVLFLAHRRRLVTQIGERLGLFGVPHGYLMPGLPADGSAPVQVCSRDTLLSRVVRNGWIAPPPADLVVYDEAHTSGADESRRLLDLYPDAYALGLTATPARSDGRPLSPYWQALVCAAPVSELIAGGYVVPFRCYAPNCAKGKGRRLAGDPVANWLLYGEGRPTILFASKVEASLAAAEAFRAAGVPAEHLDHSSPDAAREAVVARVKAGETRVLCNVGIYTEGVDIPELSCCVVLRLAGSYVLFAQCVGRVMRAHPAKADAVLIDHAGAVLEHGFPDEDVEWSLGEGTVDGRNLEARRDGRRPKPVVCPRCACVHRKPPCPSCGHAPAPARQKASAAATAREVLAEVERGWTDERKREERVRYWHRCLAVMAHKGAKAGAAAHMYRGRYGEWPDDGLPNVPRGGQWHQAVAELYPEYLRRVRQ